MNEEMTKCRLRTYRAQLALIFLSSLVFSQPQTLFAEQGEDLCVSTLEAVGGHTGPTPRISHFISGLRGVNQVIQGQSISVRSASGESNFEGFQDLRTLNRVIELQRLNEQLLTKQEVDYLRGVAAKMREHLIITNIGLSFTAAKQFKLRDEAPEDILDLAYIALVKSVDRFDPSQGYQFSTYYFAAARRLIFQERDRVGKVFSLSREWRALIRKINSTIESHAVRSPAPPDISSIASTLGQSERTVRRLIAAERPTTELDISRSGEEVESLDFQESSAESKNNRKELIDSLRAIVEAIQHQEMKVVLYYTFGLNNGPEMTDKELASLLAIDPKRVRYLRSEGYKSIRSQLAKLGFEF